jgi:hypothetical protein
LVEVTTHVIAPALPETVREFVVLGDADDMCGHGSHILFVAEKPCFLV